MHKADLQKKFSEHDANPNQLARIGTVQAYAHSLCTLLVDFAPAGADRDSAIAKIHEATLVAKHAILTEPDEAQLDDIQANAFTDFFKQFGDLFKGLFSSDESAKIKIGISSFITTDVGALAVDAVEYVQAQFAALPVGATDAEKQANSIAKRDAAVAKLKADAAAAGKDLVAFGKSTLIWFVETALQAVVARGLTAAAAIAVHV